MGNDKDNKKQQAFVFGPSGEPCRQTGEQKAPRGILVVLEGAAAGKIPAEIAIWSVFIIFAASTAVLFVKTANTTGITPFNRFEDALSEITRAITMRLSSKRGSAATAQ